MSLRLRLVLATVVVGAVGLLGMNVAVFRFVRTNLTNRLDEQVREVGDRFGVLRFRDALGLAAPTDAFRPRRGGDMRNDALPVTRTDQASPTPTTSATPSPRAPGPTGRATRLARRALPAGEIYTEVRSTDGRRLADPRVFSLDDDPALQLDLPAELPAATSGGTMFTVGGRGGTATSYRAAYTKVTLADGQTVNVLTALPAGELTSTLERLRWIQEIAAGVVLALIATCAWLLVRLSLRPLRSIEEAAATIAAGDLSHRIADERTRTEIGRLGASLNRMMSQIESAFADKESSQEQLRRFLADASHELRTPLTAIRGYAQLHRRSRGGVDPDTDRSMERIEDASVRMSTIVEDLLALARHEHGPVLVREPVAVDEVVRNVVADARIGAPDHAISLQVEAPGVVLGDATRIHQALANIVDNAVLHTPPGTAIEVEAAADGGRVRIQVRDHGPGIPADHLPHLFQPFYRVDPGRSRHSGGAGLGLAIADAVVKAHGGTITATSPPGQGATFVVELPSGGIDDDAPPGNEATVTTIVDAAGDDPTPARATLG